MSCLFHSDIHDWPSWGKVFQSIEAFEPLIKHIFRLHNLPFSTISKLKAGTNAVFKVGAYVIKIFAPKESGMDTDYDYKTEQFGMERAMRLNISIPKVLASGQINDKYVFKYYIMEYIDGSPFDELEKSFTDKEKYEFAGQLRVITDKLNTPCESFNNINVFEQARASKYWVAMPESFQKQRLEYLENIEPEPLVYVHGDLHADNILIDKAKKLYIIDFADALLAPHKYELAALTGLFEFEKPYMEAYFSTYDPAELAKQFFEGILLHRYGFSIIKSTFGTSIDSIDILYEAIYSAIK
jgi:aminoglycoside phosphotransferase (APT) family kinase protein